MIEWLEDMASAIVDAARRLFGRNSAANLPRRRLGGKSGSGLDALRRAAQNDPEAALFYLRQRVLISDSSGAAEFFEQTIMKKYPGLMLVPEDQAALVRMLVFGGHREAALYAAERFLNRYPVAPGWETVALSLGRLLQEGGAPAHLQDAVRHLNRVERHGVEKRDRADAIRLRDTLLFLADRDGVEIEPLPLPSAKPVDGSPAAPDAIPPPPPASLELRVASGEKKRDLRKEVSDKEKASGADGQIEASAPSALEGRSPLPLKSSGERSRPAPTPPEGDEKTLPSPEPDRGLELPTAEASRLPSRSAGLMPLDRPPKPARDAQSGAYGAPPQDEDAPRPAVAPPGGRGVGEGSYGVVDPPHDAPPANSPDSPAKRRSSLPSTGESSGNSGLSRSAKDRLYEQTPLSAPASDRETRLRSTPGKDKVSSAETTTSAEAEEKFAVLLEYPAATSPEVANAFAAAHAGGGENGRAVRTVPGLMMREATLETARGLAATLTAQEIPALIVHEAPPALREPAREGISIQLEKDDVVVATDTGRLRLPASAVLLVAMERVRLSRSSRSSQTVLELIATTDGQPRRFAFWERTLAVSACLVDGAAVEAEAPLRAMAAALADRVPAAAVADAIRDPSASPGTLPMSDTFRDHEDALAYEFLARYGKPTAPPPDQP